MFESQTPVDEKPWWEQPEYRWRLYTESFSPHGYYLMISLPRPEGRCLGPQPFPFFKVGVESILEEIEKPRHNRDVDEIAVALMKLEPTFLGNVKECLQAGKSQQARLLCIEYDPRFRAITDSMWSELFQIINQSDGSKSKRPGPVASPETDLITTYFKKNEKRIAHILSKDNSLNARRLLALEITQRVLGSSAQKPDSRVMRCLRNLVKERIPKRRDSNTHL